ncbi:MAG: histidine kinase [Mucilaginibacter sp.]|uniref:sensor histidine kinase n=1 Tax=Mucilaginibacter sp. TaxID=1882438 RepID=UPI0032647ACC
MYRSVYFIGFSVGYWFVRQLLRSNDLINRMESRHLLQQKQSAELERNLFKAKNAYLTSQINPHLLFNTLNFIYSSLYEVSKKSAEIVVLLSDMMRYSLTEIGEDGKVELYKEVEHIENMVQLNQARFNDKLNIEVSLSGEFEIRVIPLVFLTFIENIFKHGDLSDPACPAKINISFHNNILDFYTSNKVRKVNINGGHGIGVENSITRLQMAYADRFELKNEVVDNQYITNLVIDFN